MTAIGSCAWVYPPTSCLSLNPSGTNVTSYSNCSAFSTNLVAGDTVSFLMSGFINPRTLASCGPFTVKIGDASGTSF